MRTDEQAAITQDDTKHYGTTGAINAELEETMGYGWSIPETMYPRSLRVLYAVVAVLAACFREPRSKIAMAHRAWVLFCMFYYAWWRLADASGSRSFWIWCGQITLDTMACLCGMLYAQRVVARPTSQKPDVIPVLIESVIDGTTKKDICWREINSAIIVSTVAMIVLGTISACAEIHIIRDMMVQERYSSWSFALLLVCTVFVDFQAVVGMSMFCCVTLLHLVRVKSACRCLKRPETAVHAAIDRTYYIDKWLATFSDEHTFCISVVLVSGFLKMVFGGLFFTTEQTALATTGWIEGNVTPALAFAVFVPGMIVLLCVGPAAQLNQACMILKKAACRFIISRRKNGKEFEHPLKAFNDYIRTGDIQLRISGFAITTKMAYQVIVLTTTAVYTAAQLRAGVSNK